MQPAFILSRGFLALLRTLLSAHHHSTLFVTIFCLKSFWKHPQILISHFLSALHKVDKTKTKLTDKLNLILHSQMSLLFGVIVRGATMIPCTAFAFHWKLTDTEDEGGNLGTTSKWEQSQDRNQILARDFQNITHNVDWRHNNASTQGSGKPSKGVIFLHSSTRLTHQQGTITDDFFFFYKA